MAAGMIGGTASSAGVSMTNCWFDGSVICNAQKSYFAGFIGRVQKDSTILNCLNTGSVTHNGSVTTNGVAGFVGQVSAGKVDISHSVNAGAIAVQGGQNYGYFVGKADGTVNANNSHSYILNNLNFVYGKDNGTYSTCGRYQMSEVAGLKSLTQAKIGKLFTEEAARGYWSITKESFPVLTTFEKESKTATQAVDTSWYDASETEYTLMDSADLYGFAMLSQSNSFANKTIKLGADIVVNKGTASDWSTAAPDFGWLSIGGTNASTSTTTPRFAGTFDGQMHTISGVYLTTSAQWGGLFSGTEAGSTIKNLYLKNSYFYST